MKAMKINCYERHFNPQIRALYPGYAIIDTYCSLTQFVKKGCLLDLCGYFAKNSTENATKVSLTIH